MIQRTWTLAVLLVLNHIVQVAADDFPQPFNTEKSTSPLMSPEEAVAGMTLPPGYQVTVFASEPDIHQPIALATDDRGRLWVAENYTYAESATNYDSRLRDRIVILEDVDGDGRFDSRKIFWDRGRRLTSLEIGHGGVWVLDAPNLLFIPDTNSDDIPDGEPVVMLDGWDDNAARHTIVNGLRWGPDGWLYGRNGIMAVSRVGTPGSTPDQRTSLDCGIWRFHPHEHKFEVVCVGTTNPWGMDWDEHGELFFINTVIGHLWHAIPGARFRRMYGEHLQPHTYGVIEQTADHFHWDTNDLWHDIRKDGVTIMTPTTDEAGGGHAHCGMMILQGSPFPKEYQGSVLALNLHGRRVNRDTLHRDGASYTARHAEDFLKVNDPWFRGVEIVAGHGGEIFIADWSDTGECHENEGVHRTSGRIYRLTNVGNSGQRSSPSATSVTSLTDRQLSELVASDSEWLSRKCLLELAERATQSNLESALVEFHRGKFHSDLSARIRLRHLWALHVTNNLDDQLLFDALTDSNEHVRCWAIRLLIDRDSITSDVVDKWASMAKNDSSGLVLTYLASALQRLRYEDRWPIAHALGKHAEYSNDRVLPLMVWYGVEPALLAHPDDTAKMALSCSFPTVREFISRRVASEIERQPNAANNLLMQLSSRDIDPNVILDVLRGMADALRGWRKATPPSAWDKFAEMHLDITNNEIATLVRELSLVFGDGRAIEELRIIAASGTTSVPERRAAVRSLVLARDPGVLPLLKSLLDNRDMCTAAIQGLAAYGDAETPRLLISKFQGFSLPAKQAAITTLVSRPEFANALLEAISDGAIDRSMVSAFEVRQIQNAGDDRLRSKAIALWPDLSSQSQEKSAVIDSLKRTLTPDALSNASASNGRMLFKNLCSTCHVLYGEGERIAPELTGAQRSSLNYLLENIVDPSATVSPNYKLTVALLSDGRVLNGIVTANTERTLTLQTASEQIIVEREEIETLRESPVSMMPENLLRGLNEQQIKELFAYLMTTSQVPLPGNN